MTHRIPLVDLTAQYLSMKKEIDDAMSAVIAETAFVGTSGNRFVRAFEEEFAAFVGRPYCIACANGTDALEILLRGAGIGRGDDVLVPAVSWMATSEAVTTCGATPVFVDILPGEYTIDPAAAESKITPRTAAIIPVHLYGMPARMDVLVGIAERKRLFLLEDCAQAHGATLGGRQVGTFGHAAAYSFFPGKNLGAWGDAGGMLTGDERLARTVRMTSQHGQTEKKHEHLIEGRNSRMDGLQAAILSAKLRHLRAWTSERHRRADVYRRELSGVVERMQAEPTAAEGVFHMCVLEVDRRETVRSRLTSEGISTSVHYPTPLPLLPAYARFGLRREDFPVASQVTERIMSIPLYPELGDAEQDRVVAAVKGAVSASRER
jgi:dTDP-4-amino-4,6-dideoxygalactose transaminase